ncbi:MAG TPA: 16S rRNA (cytosine(967)-C(5))-methyltransferase RsmB [Bacillota bacterium]|nr:16S rRNA (cytosine(967)-C(5))-methyltransferase RsmB [Bacillota bacterium]
MSTYQIREIILDVLLKIEKAKSYSHLLIDDVIRREKLQANDARLLTEIVYGTVQRQITLDYYIDQFVKKRKQLKDWVRHLLRLSIYQMAFLDRVPEYAIINEAVDIAKRRGHKGIASLVNGVLRNIQRKGLVDPKEIDNLSIRTSHPQWLIDRWLDMYGKEITEQMCVVNLQKKPLSVRIQPLKITLNEALDELEKDGIIGEQSKFSKQGIVIKQGNIIRSRLFQEGYLTIQDQTSMITAEMLKVKPGMKVLDTCSAPGGKVTHIAELMENKGSIYAYDLHLKKISLIEKQAKKLQLSIIQSKQKDARELRTSHSEKSFDRILIDAPCSGLGVIRSKPDIKYNKTIDDIKRLAAIQLNILLEVAPLLKDNGQIVYSTCTVDQLENEQVIEKFINKMDEFIVDEQFFNELPKFLQDGPGITKWGLQIFPQTYNTDGFFLTRLKRKDK